MSTKYKIVIIGGSMAGLFAGVLLRRLGHDVRVYERSSQGMEGRGAGLVAQNEVLEILSEIGAESVTHSGVVARERIFLNRNNEIESRQRTPQSQISWDRLFSTFLSKMAPGGYIRGMEATTVWQAGQRAYVRFSNGEIDSADILLGTDGVGSIVRKVVAPDTVPSYAGYVAWRGLIPETALNASDAALLLDRFVFYHMPHSHILGYLVAGANGSTELPDRRYNWVWYRQVKGEVALAEVLTDSEGRRREFSLARGSMPTQTRNALVEAARALLPESLARTVELESQPFIQAIFDYEAPIFAKERIALLGDAACIVRPHTAMGVSKAAGDAMALRRHLVEHSDPIEAIAAYSVERGNLSRQIAAYGRRLGASMG
jgi:2-polyprenyl-6-methoxyphenol hydroxylase-like FAD-dependent oxidoreductase